MDSLFIDTSGWIEVFGKNEPLHDKATEIFTRALKVRRPIVTTNYIINEYLGRDGKRCRLSREDLLNVVDYISHSPIIEVVHIGEKSHSVALLLLRNRLDKEWSLVDATSFNLMNERGIQEALTTDHHFEQAKFIKLL
nr:hypothetical protein [Ktedonobacteraceae bacterium]